MCITSAPSPASASVPTLPLLQCPPCLCYALSNALLGPSMGSPHALQFLNPARFLLRKKASIGLEDVPSYDQGGGEHFLLDLGFEAPGPYELFIASAPPTSGWTQQGQAGPEALVGMSLQSMDKDSGAAAAQLGYQSLLHVPDADEGQQQAGAPSVAVQGVDDWQALHGQQVLLQQQLESLPLGDASSLDGEVQLEQLYAAQPEPSSGDGASAGAGNAKPTKPRRQAGRWTPDEVQALIEGVAAFKTSWAQIYERYVLTGLINQQRTQVRQAECAWDERAPARFVPAQSWPVSCGLLPAEGGDAGITFLGPAHVIARQVDLKDKWRNLAKLVTDPNKHSRGTELPEQQRQQILRLVLSSDVAVGAAAPDSPAAAAAVAPAAAAQDVVQHGAGELGAEEQLNLRPCAACTSRGAPSGSGSGWGFTPPQAGPGAAPGARAAAAARAT